jgi:hypothetical protein
VRLTPGYALVQTPGGWLADRYSDESLRAASQLIEESIAERILKGRTSTADEGGTASTMELANVVAVLVHEKSAQQSGVR